MAKKSPRNPYRQQLATPKSKRDKPKPPGPPRPNFNAGDLAYTSFKPLRFDIPRPTRVIDVKEGNAVGGWLLLVDTSDGPKELSATHFSRIDLKVYP